MENITNSINNMREMYRRIFKECFDECLAKIDNLNSDDDVLNFLDDYYQQIIFERAELLSQKDLCKCICCGSCCKLACSEFSPEELREKSHNGDEFARQFLSVFVPYSSKEDARRVYPDYIEMLENNNVENVFFYHCNKVTKDNKCSDYENRPQICKDFPDNPLALLPKNCGYVKWKEEVQEKALRYRALIDILDALRKNK